MDTINMRKGIEHTLRSLLPLAPHASRPEITRLAQGLGCGPHLETAQAVEAVADAGYASIVNLAEEGEPEQRMTPNVEATWAHTFELEHHRVQVRLPLEQRDVDAFLPTLARAARPVFVHSTNGRRAAALCGLALAIQHDLDGAQVLERLDQAGLRIDDARLRDDLAALVEPFAPDHRS